MSKGEDKKILELSSDEIKGLQKRLAKKNLNPEDYATSSDSLMVLVELRLLLLKKSSALSMWLRRIFSLKTEKKKSEKKYKKGIKITEDQIKQIHIVRAKFHGEWNYTILPQNV